MFPDIKDGIRGDYLPPKFKTFKLGEDLRYTRDGDIIFTIPEGFITDFASIPKIFRNIIGKMERHMPCAILHDYLYATGCVSKKEADMYFLESMKEEKVRWLKRKAMYYAVKFGGLMAWNDHRKKED